MKRILWGLGVAFLATAAQADTAADTAQEAIEAAVGRISPGATIEWIKPTSSAAMRAVKVANSGGIWLVSADGQLVIARPGAVIDTATKDNLMTAWQADAVRAALAQIPEELRIVYAAPNERHRLTVFTDVDCGYCRVLHQNMAGYHEVGISIEYVMFARAGAASATGAKHRAVLCAKDRHAALDAVKAGQPAPAIEGDCAIDLEASQALASQAGVSGTPNVSLQDGTVIGGFVPPPGAAKAIADWEQRQAAVKPVAAAGR